MPGEVCVWHGLEDGCCSHKIVMLDNSMQAHVSNDSIENSGHGCPPCVPVLRTPEISSSPSIRRAGNPDDKNAMSCSLHVLCKQ